MKKIKYFLAGFLILSFVSISCVKLEEEIVSGITSEFYATPVGLRAAVNAAYAPFRTYYGDHSGTALVVFGTDEYTNGGHGGNRYFNWYTPQLNEGAGPLWRLWNFFYQGINTCNTAISRSEQLVMPESEKNALLGEVRFLRAHYYFELVRHFGPVHLTLEETIGVETEAYRTPENEIYTAIIDDLEFAINSLPDRQSDFGRATRPAAEHMLSLVLLTRGYKDFAAANDFSRAAELAKNVIEDYHHKLLPDFLDVFDHDNEENDEVIWAIQYTQDLILNASGNGTHMYFGAWFSFYRGLDDSNQPGYGRPWIRYRPTPYLLENFRPLDVDSRYTRTFQDVWYYNAPDAVPEGSAVGDTAIWVTHEYLTQEDYDRIMARMPNLILFSWHLDNMDAPWYRPINMFPWPEKKFSDYKRVGAWTTQGSRNWIVYRVAETYLNLAEALLQDGRAAEAVPYINAIRERAAWPGLEDQMTITEADVDLDFILDERARELYGEMRRWHVLNRTGTFLERIKKHNPEAAPNVQAFHQLRPIPTNQLIRTTNEYPQNPGY